MEWGLSFATGVVVAIISSVPMGPIAFAIVHGVMTRGKAAGARIGIGGLIIDAIFAFVGMRLFGLVAPEDSPAVFDWINLLSIPVLVFLGVKMIRDRNKIQEVEGGRRNRGDLFFGFSLGLSNPVLFGYWLWVASYVTGEGWVTNTLPAHVLFGIGVAAGMGLFIWGWVSLLSFATVRTGHRFRSIFSLLIGIGFLAFSAYLAIRYLVVHV